MAPACVRVPPGDAGPDCAGLLRRKKVERDCVPRGSFDAQNLPVERSLPLE